MEQQPKTFTNYMIEDVSEQHLQVGTSICADEKTVTDSTGLSNKEKWNKVEEIFKTDKATIFASIDYEGIYHEDQARNCEGAAYVAELRAQFFSKMLSMEPSNRQYHALYLQNRVWQVRLRERANMDVFVEVAKRVSKPY